MNTPEIANTAEALIQTIMYGGMSYIVSQVRICRKCKQTITVTDGNHRLYFNKIDRIALHEHIQCPQTKGYFGDNTNDIDLSNAPRNHTVYSATEKQDFLYPNRKY